MLILSALVALLDPSPAGAEPAGRGLTVDELAARAVERALNVADARLEVRGARAAERAAKTRYGPRLVVEGKALYFNERATADLGLETGEVPAAFQQLVDSLLPSGPVEVGEFYNVEARASLAQPLTQLGAVRELHRIKSLDVDVAAAHLAAARAAAAHEAREAAYRLLSLRANVASLEQTEEELAARLEQAQAFLRAELVGPEQVLEVRVHLAEVREGLSKARAFQRVAEARLRIAARLEPGSPLVIVEPTDLPPLPDLEAVREAALDHRPELVELRLRRAQAEAGVRARGQKLLPGLSLVGTAQYQAGSSFDVPALAVGLVLSWTPLDWGEGAYELREARAAARRAELGVERAAELLALDVERAWAAARAARETLEAARARRAHAEELYRLERARFDNNSATATDLLGAQAALLRARTQETTGRYDYLIALSALRRATGDWR